jgi:hypothetical protein
VTARLDLSGAFVSPDEPDELPARVCSCHGAVLRGEGSADEGCPLHGLEAEELAGDVELVDGLHPLCRDTHHVWVHTDEGSFPARLECHELAGHPPGEGDGGHGTRSGERW